MGNKKKKKKLEKIPKGETKKTSSESENESGKTTDDFSEEETLTDEKESDGEVRFDDGLDENLIGDEADRRKLEQMMEMERERELFVRMERREAMKLRMEIAIKLNSARKRKEKEKKTEWMKKKRKERKDKKVRLGEFQGSIALRKGKRRKKVKDKKAKAIDDLEARRSEKKEKKVVDELAEKKEEKSITSQVFLSDDESDDKGEDQPASAEDKFEVYSEEEAVPEEDQRASAKEELEKVRHKKITTRHEYNGLFYNSSSSLRTTDQCIAMSLLKDKKSEMSSTAVKEVHARNGLVICEVENVLTERQCNDIIKTSSTCSFQNMGNKYDPKKERNNSRLLVLDEDLSKHLWNQIGAILLQVVQDNNISLCPLGFDVLKGSWEFDGVNDAIRINRYSSDKSEYFAPHKDGQYCPSGDRRSIFSLVLYLNEGFKGGETCFYLPKGTKGQTKAMTVEEEIKAVGGLEKGFNLVTVTPTTGCAVLFSQNILHESTPLIMQKKSAHKIILKTDVMLSRKDKPFGFSVSLKERDDYFDCLNYFRKAQQKELSGETKEASELYERALSLRYCYPAALKNLEHPDLAVVSVLSTAIFPACVWENIFTYLNGQEAEMVVYAFPDLKPIRKLQEERFSLKLEAMPVNKRPLFYPKIDHQHGIYTCFEFSDANFFRENEEGCCRVAAIYSFFLLGHNPSDTMYTVHFNPDTQEVCAMPLDKLLWDVFHNQPCYGAIYKVRQQSKVKDIGKDFANSVGRSYMALRHYAEFIGIDVSDTFRAKTIVTKLSGYSEPSSDESSDLSSDDDDSLSNEDSDADELSDDDQSNSDEDSEASAPPNKKQRSRKVEENEYTESNTVHVNGEIDVTVKSHIFLRMLDEAGFFTDLDLPCEDHAYEMWLEALDEICDCLRQQSHQKPIKEVYLKWLLERCSDHASISAAFVSSVKQPIEINGDAICLCGMGKGAGYGHVCSQLSDVCEVNTYNHLVFDFLENQLSVEHVQDENFGNCQNDDDLEEPEHDCSTCYLSTILRSHVKSQSREKIMKALTHGDMKHFNVCIAPLAKAFVPFNHASCQCTFPSVKVNEYVNLRTYPYLNHLHLITQDIDDKIYVWSVYGGIVAL